MVAKAASRKLGWPRGDMQATGAHVGVRKDYWAPRPPKFGMLESHGCQSTSVGHDTKMAKVNLPPACRDNAEIQLISRTGKELMLRTYVRFRPAAGACESHVSRLGNDL